MSTNEEKNVLCGEPVDTNIGVTLGQFLQAVLRGHKDLVLQVDATTGECLTAAQLLRRGTRLARWLRARGAGVGDVISICSENRLEFSVVFCATLLLGATLAPMNPLYTSNELLHVLSITKPKIIFASSKSYAAIVQSTCRAAQTIIYLDTDPVWTRNVISYKHVINSHTEALVEAEEPFESPVVNVKENVFAIMCSSGTTGLPKGVMQTQHNVISMLCIMKQIATIKGLESVSEVSIGLIPFFHSMGLLCNLLSMVAGHKLIVFQRFEWRIFLQTLQDHKISTLVVPPSIIVMLCQSPIVKEYNLSSLKYIRSAAAPMSGELQKQIYKKYNLKEVTQGYGLTEATLGVLLVPKLNKFGSVGKIVPGMKVKVTDERGAALGPHSPGELRFWGPLIMKGYAGDEQATAAAIDADNWLRTGDVGYYDREGYFYVVDRLKELIKYKGFQVPPAELEAILLTHPAIADAAVIGLPDELAGEVPVAYVVLEPSVQRPTSVEVQTFVNRKVSPQKHLRGGVRFIDAIPRNITGKILRRNLRQLTINTQSKL